MRKHPKIEIPIPEPDIPVGPSQHAMEQMRAVQAELAERRIEALRLYRPMPLQEEFHQSLCSERILIGGNRCLHGSQELLDPSTGIRQRVDQIKGEFRVHSLADGCVTTATAGRPFIKARDHLFAFRLSNGGELRCTLDHMILDAAGDWRAVRDVLTPECAASLRQTIQGTCHAESRSNALRSSRRLAGSLGGCRLGRRSCGGLLRKRAGVGQAFVQPPADARGCSRKNCCRGDLGSAARRTLFCPASDRPSSTDVLSRASGLVSASRTRSACTPCSRLWNCAQGARLSLPLFYARPHTTRASGQSASRSCYAFPSQAPVECEHLYITAYRYLGQGDVWDIEVAETHNYVIDGLVNHNSGKSLSSFVEDARAATGRDPYGKYPETDGNLVIVGRNWPHIGLVAYPMLFRAGAFRIIRDEKTNEWRSFDPNTDGHRRKEAKPAPPLIPPRFVKEVSWVLKSAQYCQKVTLVNGWVINFFSSEGDPPQGFQADLVHIDEDINNERWVGEMQARLADRKGRFVWSAMPHSKNDALLGLCERAEKEVEAGNPNPIIKKFTLRFLDNAHIDEEEKRKNIERWAALGMDELKMRAEGEFTTESTLMYPTFNQSVHIHPRAELPGGVVPPDWTRYVAIDPGHAVMACVFGAVPPDERFLLLYDELYIRQCNSLIFGEQFADKAREQHFYNFIMDMHGGMLRDLGSGRLPHELYSEELKKRGIRSQVSNHSFTPGSDDIPARTSMVRQMLHIRGDGSTKLKILEGSCPNLVREMRRYRKKTQTINGQVFVTDEPQTRGDVHAVQCMEYLCAYEPKYHQPPKSFGPEPWWVKWLADKPRRLGLQDESCVILGPVGYQKR